MTRTSWVIYTQQNIMQKTLITEPGAVATAFNEPNKQVAMKAVATAPGSVMSPGLSPTTSYFGVTMCYAGDQVSTFPD